MESEVRYSRCTETRLELATKFKGKMKNLIFLAGFLLLNMTAVIAQSEDDEVVIIKVYDRYDDKLVFELTNDMWLDMPDGVKLRGFSPGFKGYFFTDYTFGRESNFSFAWGFGVSFDNVHSNAVLVQEEFPNGELGEQTLTPFPEEYEYEKNK